MGVIGHAQGLHSAAHRMRPRILGDPPSGSRSPLQSSLRADFHCDRYRLQSLSLLARCACQEGSQVHASIAGAVPGGTAEGGCAWNKQILLRRDAFETMRDVAADAYRVETGSMWRPRRGSHTSQTGKLTSAAIDARDYQRARKDRKTMAHLPQGTLVAITGGKDIANPAAVIERLDKARAKYADIILVHGGGPGVEKIAASWV